MTSNLRHWWNRKTTEVAVKMAQKAAITIHDVVKIWDERCKVRMLLEGWSVIFHVLISAGSRRRCWRPSFFRLSDSGVKHLMAFSIAVITSENHVWSLSLKRKEREERKERKHYVPQKLVKTLKKLFKNVVFLSPLCPGMLCYLSFITSRNHVCSCAWYWCWHQTW